MKLPPKKILALMTLGVWACLDGATVVSLNSPGLIMGEGVILALVGLWLLLIGLTWTWLFVAADDYASEVELQLAW